MISSRVASLRQVIGFTGTGDRFATGTGDRFHRNAHPVQLSGRRRSPLVVPRACGGTTRVVRDPTAFRRRGHPHAPGGRMLMAFSAWPGSRFIPASAERLVLLAMLAWLHSSLPAPAGRPSPNAVGGRTFWVQPRAGGVRAARPRGRSLPVRAGRCRLGGGPGAASAGLIPARPGGVASPTCRVPAFRSFSDAASERRQRW